MMGASASFVPDKLKRLTRGSHEYVINEVKCAVETAGENLFESTPRIVATFAHHAIVEADGRYQRVTLERDSTGNFTAVLTEDLGIDKIGPDNIGDYLRSKAEGIAESLLGGRQAAAEDAIRDLLPQVQTRDPTENEES